MKKKIIALLTILALVITLAACSASTTSTTAKNTTNSAANTTTTAKPLDTKKTEISITWWGNDARHKKFNAIFDLYEQKFPQYKVNRDFGAMPDLFAKLTTQAASNNMPDIPGMASMYIGDYADKGLLDDLQQYSGKGLDLSKFSKGAIISGTYKGVLYMITGGDTAHALGYNKTQLDKLGIPLPKSQMTWEEYLEYAKSIKAKLTASDSWAIMDETLGSSQFCFESFIRNRGYELMTTDGKAVGYTKELVAEWLKYWQDLRKAGLVPPPNVMAENATKSYQDMIQYQGKVFCFGVQLNQLKIAQNVTKDELGAVRLPIASNAKNKHVELLQPSAFSIAKNSKNKEAALKLISWFVNDQEVQKLFDMEWGVPASSDINKMLMDNLKPATNMIDISKKVELTLIADIGNTIIPHPGRQSGTAAILADLTNKSQTVMYEKSTPEQAADAHIKAANQILAGK